MIKRLKIPFNTKGYAVTKPQYNTVDVRWAADTVKEGLSDV